MECRIWYACHARPSTVMSAGRVQLLDMDATRCFKTSAPPNAYVYEAHSSVVAGGMVVRQKDWVSQAVGT